MNMNLQEQIRNRLETGFKNWNGGYENWLNWCETLYEPDAYYNIPLQGPQRRLTLQEYKDMMGHFFKLYDVELGEFKNMIIKENWCAIRYVVHVTNKNTGEMFTQNTMEFVEFKDNGGEIGARVVEGWALSDITLG
jgi:hypothetical protein